MGTTLATLSPPAGARRPRKRKGRGPGSGNGTTAGKGQKGQKSRSGNGIRPGFEGGQMPLQRRLPKRGFKNPFRVAYHAVNLDRLTAVFEAGTTVTVEAMRERGLAPRSAKRIKVLGQGDLGHALTIEAHKFSASALEKIQKAGGTATVVGTKGEAAAASGTGAAAESASSGQAEG